MKFPKRIRTERLILKALYPPTFRLAQDHFAVIDKSRETLREWLDWVDKTHVPEDIYNDYLVNWCQKNWESKTGYAYQICQKKDGAIIGSIDFFRIDSRAKSGEIGYWLTDDARGHGYMTEALRGFEKVIFERGFNRIMIGNDTQNIRSVRVTERAGYHLDGVMRQDAWDAYHNRLRDTNVWSRLKSEWEHQKS